MFCKMSWPSSVSETTWDQQKLSERLPLWVAIKESESKYCMLRLDEKMVMLKVFSNTNDFMGLWFYIPCGDSPEKDL